MMRSWQHALVHATHNVGFRFFTALAVLPKRTDALDVVLGEHSEASCDEPTERKLTAHHAVQHCAQEHRTHTCISAAGPLILDHGRQGGDLRVVKNPNPSDLTKIGPDSDPKGYPGTDHTQCIPELPETTVREIARYRKTGHGRVHKVFGHMGGRSRYMIHEKY